MAHTPRNAQQAVLGSDVIALMDALHIDRAILAGFDWGARSANIVAALWPSRCRAMVSVSGYLIGNRETNRQPLLPHPIPTAARMQNDSPAYEHRLIAGAGHNLPQETPAAFIEAILDADSFAG